MPFCGYLKQSTAVDILLGPFIDDTDGKSAETGLTLDVEVSKNGQALANKNDATAPVHDAAGTVDGYYNCELDATDTGTLGILSVVAHAAGFLPVHQTYQIVVAHWYDTMCSTDYLQVDVIQVGGTAQTANDNGADINAILVDTGTTLDGKIDTIDTNVDAILVDTGTTLDGKIDTIDTNVDAILVDTAVIGALGAGLTAVPWNSAWDAQVESEVTDSLVAHNLDHLALTATAAADMTTEVADNTILSRILANGDTSAFVPSTDGLQLIRDKQTDIETDTAEIGAAGAGLSAVPWNAAWDAEVESEVDDALGGGTGTALTAIPWNAAWDAEVQSEVDDALVAQKLDHLIAVADADDAVNDSIVAKLAASDGDWSGFDNSADSLEALRDRGDAAWTTGSGTGLTALATGTAQAGAAGTITLAAGESATNDLYNGTRIALTGNTGAGQSRIVTDYVGATKVASIAPNWTTNPDNTTTYEIQASDAAVGWWRGAQPNALASGRVDADAGAISGDSTAADNLELDYDGTGYAKANSTIGTCTTNTDVRGTDNAALAATALTDATWTDARAGYLDELGAANIPADLDATLTDTNELQGDLTDGGRLDLLIDAIKAKTDNLPADPADDSDIDAQLATIVADTNELQADWVNGGRLDLLIDAILADTNELQTDDYPTTIAAVQTTADAIETDTQDIQSRLPAALVTGRMSSDAVAISGSTDAADKLEASVETIVTGTVNTGNTAATTTTFVSDDVTEATADHYNGRIVIWTSGNLLAQATDITDYSLDGNSEGAFVVTAMTEAPANNDTFVIV